MRHYLNPTWLTLLPRMCTPVVSVKQLGSHVGSFFVLVNGLLHVPVYHRIKASHCISQGGIPLLPALLRRRDTRTTLHHPAYLGGLGFNDCSMLSYCLWWRQCHCLISSLSVLLLPMGTLLSRSAMLLCNGVLLCIDSKAEGSVVLHADKCLTSTAGYHRWFH